MNPARLEYRRHSIRTSEDEEVIPQLWRLGLTTSTPTGKRGYSSKPYFRCAINERR
jgi:hypothetical protein